MSWPTLLSSSEVSKIMARQEKSQALLMLVDIDLQGHHGLLQHHHGHHGQDGHPGRCAHYFYY